MRLAHLLFLLCLLTFLCTSVRAQCPASPVVLSTDAEVASFFTQYPNCTNYANDLILEAGVTDLSPFANIVSVGGDFLLTGLPVDNLDGIAGLKGVDGDFWLVEMPLDNDLATVPLNLLTVGGSLLLNKLNEIKQVDALQNLESVGELAIVKNDVLENMEGLQGVMIGTLLNILSNPQLSECANQAICEALVLPLPDINISNNAGNCANYFEVQAACLGNPACPPGLVELSTNQDINNFEGAYPNCVNLPGELLINGTAANLTPTGMETVAGNVTIRGVVGLTDVDRFALSSVGGDLLFETLSVGPDLANGALPLQTVGGSLSLAGLGSLETVDALGNVTSLGGLFLGDLFSLQDIDGLTNVTVTDLLAIFNLDQFIGLDFLDPLDLDGQTLSTLSILDNAQLEDISALEGFTVTDDLRIRSNTNLEQCNVDPVCEAIAADIGIIQIANNATGCTSVAEVKAICLPILEALMAFYVATDGPNWDDNTGWAAAAAGSNCTPCDGTWTGITCQADKVVTLTLRDNNLTGNIDFPELSLFTDLQLINLNDNNLSGPIPDLLFDLPSIRNVSLQSNDFTGGIPSNLGNATDLGLLNISGNENLGGTIPFNISGLSNLILLNLSNCGLTGPLPNATIGNLTELTNFNVSRNELTGQFGGNFGSLTKLININISDDQFSSLLPGIFDLLPDLTSFDASFNQFIGPLPASFSGAVALDYLNVQGNSLTGSLPNLSNLTNLRSLNLANNEFFGMAPRLDQSPRLTIYYLFGNAFSGTLADDLLSTTMLSGMLVADNQLTGELPEFLVNSAATLSNVSFADNGFSGCYPASYAGLCSINTDFTGNVELPYGGSNVGFDVEFCQNNDLCGTSLPVIWTSFSAVRNGKQVVLNWSTASEENNEKFIIEHLVDGIGWATLGWVAAAGQSGINTYSFLDETPFVGDNFYRLRQVDVDGQYSFSAVRQVAFDASARLAWPNLVQESLSVYSTDPEVVVLYDLNGRKVLEFEHLGGGAQVQRVELRSGVYLLRMQKVGKVQRLFVQ